MKEIRDDLEARVLIGRLRHGAEFAANPEATTTHWNTDVSAEEREALCRFIVGLLQREDYQRVSPRF
jgi:hypothetical protein